MKNLRRSAAILSADVAGYTRLMDASEAETHNRLIRLLDQMVDPMLTKHGGTVVKSTGDGFLAHFETVDNAVDCALRIQREISEREADQSADRRIALRMGINVGDIIIEKRDIYGAAVNIAARLQELAEPGGLMVSGAVRGQLTSLTARIIDLGSLPLKNISAPVRTYRIVAGASAHPSASNRTSLDRVPSVAVLPFRALDADPSKAYFAASIVEDIIAALASRRELRVISRNSTLSYGSDADVAEVGADLGVRYVVSGSVRRGTKGDRITAELADTETKTALWARTFDAEGEDLFDVQDRIIRQIMGTLAPRMREAEIRRAFQKRPESLTAYDHVLQALHHLYRLDEADFAKAGALLQRAIALDDSYATAHMWAAQWHHLRLFQGWSPDPEAEGVEAMRLAQAAVDRDGDHGQALAQLGHFRSMLGRDYDGAIALFARAIEASPGNAWVWGLSAPTYSYVGDGNSAISRAERAISLSPQDAVAFWYHTSLCIAFYTRGDYHEAVLWGEVALRENPRYTAAMRHTAAALAALGRIDEAEDIGRRILTIDQGFRVTERAGNYPYRDGALRERLACHLLAAGLPP